jgi:hypothetical protein
MDDEKSSVQNLSEYRKATNYVNFDAASNYLRIDYIIARLQPFSNLNAGTYKLAVIIEKAHSFRYLVKPPCKVLIPALLFISHRGM